MPRYYCDYCDTYLTHDSPSVRKQHNAGYKHKGNVRTYYQQFEEQQTQSLIDQRIKEHLGQAAAYQQVGAPFNQLLTTVPGMAQRPRLPLPLPPPMLPLGPSPQGPMLFGIGPPAGYGTAPLPPVSMQMNSIPRPPTLEPPISGARPTATPNGAALLTNPAMFQPNPISAPVPSAPSAEAN